MFSSSLLQGSIGLLLQQQLIGQLSNLGDGISLTEALLQRQIKSGREISAEAITGRLRSDVGSLRQSARNLREGGSIAEIAQKGIGSIVESLKKMQELAQNAATATSPAEISAAIITAYQTHASSIRSIIKDTSYNGISLMDGTQWAADPDQRVSRSGNGTVSISIQAGRGVRPLTLTDFSGDTLGSADPLTQTLNANNASTLASELSVLIQNMKMHERSYGHIASSMESEAKSVERQSRIMDLTATRTIAGSGTDPASRLLFFLLSEQGKLIDDKG